MKYHLKYQFKLLLTMTLYSRVMTILVTAFGPFGPFGKYARGKNASEEVLSSLTSQRPGQFSSFVLPVSINGINLFRSHLGELKPDAILCMGELLSLPRNTVRVEPYAHDTALDGAPLASLFSKKKIPSPFVQDLFPEQQTTSSIGHYFCNQIYVAALKWAEAYQNPPTAFIHLSVLGNRDKQAADVLQIYDRMLAQIPQRTRAHQKNTTAPRQNLT